MEEQASVKLVKRLLEMFQEPWDPLDPFAPPEGSGLEEIQVNAMRGEYRAAAVNVYNATREPIDAWLSFEELPDQIASDGVTVDQVDWTETADPDQSLRRLRAARAGHAAQPLS